MKPTIRSIATNLMWLALSVATVIYGILPIFESPKTAHAQGTSTPYDCTFSYTFTGATAQTGQANNNAARPCVAWRVTFSTVGFTDATVQFETSPDNVTWTAVTNSICSSSVQPPCVVDGANPITAGKQGTAQYKAYGKYVRVNVTGVTGSGTGIVVIYGNKGAGTASSGGGGGGVVGPTGPTGPQGPTGPASGSGVTFSTATVLATTAPVADEWLMQEGSGSTFADTSGTANTVTANSPSTITWNTSGPGRCAGVTCAHFSSSTGTNTSANATNFTPSATQPWTITGSISFDSTTAGQSLFVMAGVGGARLDFGKQVTSTANEFYFTLLNNAGNGISMRWFLNPAAATMYDFALTYDGSRAALGVKLYINGRNIRASTLLQDAFTGAFTLNTVIYLAGGAGQVGPFVGYMADMRTWTRQLTYNEIAAIHRASLAGVYTTATRTNEYILASSFATLDSAPSAIGCTTTKIGGGTPTNNDDRFNAVMATVSVSLPLYLKMDGCMATNGVYLPQAGYWDIDGIGQNNSGFVTFSGANSAPLSNGYGAEPLGAPPAQGAAIKLSNLSVNGNRGTYPNGNASYGGDAKGGNAWIVCVELSSISGMRIENVWVTSCPTYGIVSTSISFAYYTNVWIDAPTRPLNTDGIHIDGNSSNIFISNVRCGTGDDCIPLNSAEGQGAPYAVGGWAGSGISNVTINNIQVATTFSAIRVYGCSGAICPGISNVTIDGVVGDVTNRGMIFSSETSSASKAVDSITGVKVTNVNLTGKCHFDFGDPIGNALFAGISCNPTETLPFFRVSQGTLLVSDITFRDINIYRNTVGNSAMPFMTLTSGTVIKKLTTDNVNYVNQYGQSYSAVASLIDVPSGAAITTLSVTNPPDKLLTTALVSSGSFARITNVQGTILPPLTVSTLPTCNTASQAAVSVVTDATIPTYLGALTGGSNVVTSVICNGTAWVSN